MKLVLSSMLAAAAATDVTVFRAERLALMRLVANEAEISGVCGRELCVTHADVFANHAVGESLSLENAYVCSSECDEALHEGFEATVQRSLGGACVVAFADDVDASLALAAEFEPLSLTVSGYGDLVAITKKHQELSDRGEREPFDRLKQRVVDNVDASRMFSVLKQLAGDSSLPTGDTIATRYTHAKDWEQDGPAMALDLVESQFLQANGLCDRVFRQPIMVKGTPSFNVVCEHLGLDESERVVFGAHWDSTSDKPTVRAPGAVDDGSGTVTVLEVARSLGLLAQQTGGRLPYTVHVAAWGGEEQGLFGSQQYVDDLVANGVRVRQAIMVDMSGYSNKYFGLKVEGTRNAEIQKLMAVAKDNTLALAELSHAQTSISFGSDHVPFQKAGYPCVLFIQQDDTNYKYYHKTGDDTSQINQRQLGAIARVFVATAVDTLMSPF